MNAGIESTSGIYAYVDGYLDRFGRLDPKTIERKEYYLKHLIDYFDRFGIDLVFDVDTTNKFISYLESKGLKDSYIKTVLREVKSFLRYLKKQGHFTLFDEEAVSDYFKGIKKTNLENGGIEYYEDDEIRVINEFLKGKIDGVVKPPVYYILLNFLRHSGLRLAEALNLYPDDIYIKKVKASEEELLAFIDDENIKNELIYFIDDEEIREFLLLKTSKGVIKRLDKSTKEMILDTLEKILKEKGLIKDKELFVVDVKAGKFGKRRTVPMLLLNREPIFKNMFKEWLRMKKAECEREGKPVKLFSYEYRDENGVLLQRVEDPNPNTIQASLNRWSKELQRYGYNIKLKAHTFRKTYATKLAEEGLPVEEVKEIMGHESISTTLRYYAKATQKGRERKWEKFL